MSLQQLIGTRAVAGGQVATGPEQMSKQNVVICYDSTNIKLMFYGMPSYIGTLGSNLQIKAAIWKNGTPFQCLFGGSPTLSAAPDGVYTSDVFSGLSFVRGDIAEIRVYVKVTSGTDILITQYLALSEADGFESGTGLTDKTMSGTITAVGGPPSQPRAYTAGAIIGDTTGYTPAVIISGDSISIGTGDSTNNYGYLAIAYNANKIPYARVGAGGSTGASAPTNLSQNFFTQSLVPKCTHVSWEYGVNDLASTGTPAALVTNFQNYKTAILAYNSTLKFSISTVLPVTQLDNSGPQVSGYWNSTKESNRVSYNNLLRANYVSYGADFLWEAAGDASGTSGLHKGAEATKDGGVFRSDYTNQNGFTSIGDGLHPNRPIITAAAAGLDTQAFLNVTPTWGPELIYAKVPTTGKGVELHFLEQKNTSQVLSNTLTVTNISSLLSSVAQIPQFIDKTTSFIGNLNLYRRFQSGEAPTLTIGSSSGIKDSLNNFATPVTITIYNASTYTLPSFNGAVVSSDNFTRANTSYNSTPGNNTVGTQWIDVNGNAARIQSNKFELQGYDARPVQSTYTSRLDSIAEVVFDPADFTSSNSEPFSFKLGVRWSGSGTSDPTAGNTNGVFAYINRNSDLNGLQRLSVAVASGANEFSTNGAVSNTWNNGTEYRVRITVTGTSSGGNKVCKAEVFDNSTSTLLNSINAANMGIVSNISGNTVLVSCQQTTNNASATNAASVILRSFANIDLTETNPPVVVTGSISSSGTYIDYELADQVYPIQPNISAAGFSLISGSTPLTIANTYIYNDNYVRQFFSPVVYIGNTVTWSYTPATGNITDSNIPTPNEVAGATLQAVINNSTQPQPSVTGIILTPLSKVIPEEDSVQLIAVVNGANNPSQAVTYSITSGEGTVSNTGIYNAPTASTVDKLTIVRATSVFNPSVFTEVTYTTSAGAYNTSLNLDMRALFEGFLIKGGTSLKRRLKLKGSSVTFNGQVNTELTLPNSIATTLVGTDTIDTLSNKILDKVQVTTSTTSGIPLVIKTITSQTGDILEWQNASNSILGKFDSTGKVFTLSGISSPVGSGTNREIFGNNNIISTNNNISVFGVGNTISGTSTNSNVYGISNTVTSALFSILLGTSNTSSGNNSVIIGKSSTISSGTLGSISVGNVNTISGTDALAFGNNITTTSTNTVTIGTSSASSGNRGVSLGYSSTSNTDSLALGSSSNSGGVDSISIGANSSVGATQGAIAIGKGAVSPSITNSIAIGNSFTQPTALTTISTGVGSLNSFTSNSATIEYDLLGNNNNILGSTKVFVFGSSNTVNSGRYVFVFGTGNTITCFTNGIDATVVGFGNTAGTGNLGGAVIVGNQNTVDSHVFQGVGTIIGSNNTIGSVDIVLGNNNSLSNQGFNIIAGQNNTMTAKGSIILGRGMSSTSQQEVIFGTDLYVGGFVDFYFGAGYSQANISGVGAAVKFRTTAGSGTNTQGQTIQMYPGYSSGNAESGNFQVYTAPITNGSGTGLNNTYVKRIDVQSNNSTDIYSVKSSEIALKILTSNTQTADIQQWGTTAPVTLARMKNTGVIVTNGYETMSGYIGADYTQSGLVFRNGLYVSGSISSASTNQNEHGIIWSGYTPISTGADSSVLVLPYSVADGTTSITWIPKRITVRSESQNGTGGNTSLVFQSSSSTGTFTTGGNISVATVVLGQSVNEVSVSGSGLQGTYNSGTKYRLNITSLNPNHGPFFVSVLWGSV